jgi:hypothetical protein
MSAGTSPGGVSMPASSSSTERLERADSRLAITQPAEPPPTTMVSNDTGELLDISIRASHPCCGQAKVSTRVQQARNGSVRKRA